MNNRVFFAKSGLRVSQREQSGLRFIVFETNSRCQDEEWGCAGDEDAHHNGVGCFIH